MKAVLEVLVAELRRLQAHGVQRVPLAPDTLELLRKAVLPAGAPVPRAAVQAFAAAPAPAMPPAPSPVRAPSREEHSLPAEPELLSMPRASSADTTATRSAKARPTEPKLPPPTPFTLPGGDKQTRWNWLHAQVMNDPVCRENVRPGKQVVLGVGSLDADLFFVGEAPGAEEEIRGEPFVGPAGELLTKMIQAMGLQRSQVYIGNIMNWRPQLPTIDGQEQVGNRKPTGEEMAYCAPYLKAQLEIVGPKVIIALGKTAVDGLLGEDRFKTLGEARGKWFEYGGLPLMVTFHPSYLLRNQSIQMKRVVWEDLLQVMERAGMPISEKQRGFFLAK